MIERPVPPVVTLCPPATRLVALVAVDVMGPGDDEPRSEVELMPVVAIRCEREWADGDWLERLEYLVHDDSHPGGPSLIGEVEDQAALPVWVWECPWPPGEDEQRLAEQIRAMKARLDRIRGRTQEVGR